MPHVSKKPLEKDVYHQISENLNWLLTDIRSKELMKLFLYDFFTKTERIMLAKRLALVLLIHQNYDVEIITKVLHVSTATVYRMREWVDRGGRGLKTALNKLVHREQMQGFLRKIEKLTADIFERKTIRKAIFRKQ